MWDQPRPPSELAPGLPAPLERLILRCLRKEPERRYQCMADVRLELQEIKEEREAANSASRVPMPRRGARRLAAALAVALALTAPALLLWRRSGSPPPTPRLVPLTALPGIEATPAFAPDGTQIAFSWDGEASDVSSRNFDIWLKLVEGSEARRLTVDSADDMGPSWSPDGRYIAFHRGRLGATGTIFLVSPLGGPERKLGDLKLAGSDTTWFRGAAVPQLSWSPDGQWLAVARARGKNARGADAGGIVLIPVNGGEIRPVTSLTEPGVHRDPAFSPDGSRLAYASCPLPHAYAACDLHIVELGSDARPRSPPRRVTRADLSIFGLVWTEDGTSLVYGAARMGFSHLWRVGVDGTAPAERIEAARGGLSPAIVGGRNRLAFAQTLRDVDVFSFETGRPDAIVAASSNLDHGPSFSPDGRRFAFESGRSGEVHEIWLANADGSNPVQLTRGPGIWQGSPSWSPDGRVIAFDSRGEDGLADIWTIDLDGAGLRRLTWAPLDEVLPTWSRDGRWVYYQEQRPEGPEIFRIPTSGGAGERVTRNGGFYAHESPDGRSVFFVRRDDSSPLFSQPVAGGPEHQVVDCVVSRSLAAGPDGVYYLGCPPDVREAPLYRLETGSGVSRRLGVVGIGGGFVPGLSVSPDGKRVLFSKQVADVTDLMMIEGFR